MHTTAQILICGAGEGWVQEEGKSAHKMIPGDVFIVAPNTKHWHGADRNSWFAHLSVMDNSTKSTWLEPVNADEYTKLK